VHLLKPAIQVQLENVSSLFMVGLQNLDAPNIIEANKILAAIVSIQLVLNRLEIFQLSMPNLENLIIQD
jgi:hypothetical protein